MSKIRAIAILAGVAAAAAKWKYSPGLVAGDLVFVGGTSDRFCTIDCAGNPGICPVGFSCQKLGSTAGEFSEAMQCIPINGICCIDVDKDGRGKGGGCIAGDCNDADPRVYDDAKEVCDGVDNDCMGGVDVSVIDCKLAECSLRHSKSSKRCCYRICSTDAANRATCFVRRIVRQ